MLSLWYVVIPLNPNPLLPVVSLTSTISPGLMVVDWANRLVILTKKIIIRHNFRIMAIDERFRNGMRPKLTIVKIESIILS